MSFSDRSRVLVQCGFAVPRCIFRQMWKAQVTGLFLGMLVVHGTGLIRDDCAVKKSPGSGGTETLMVLSVIAAEAFRAAANAAVANESREEGAS